MTNRNTNGLTFNEWLIAAGYDDRTQAWPRSWSLKLEESWAAGEDPNDWRPQEPPPAILNFPH